MPERVGLLDDDGSRFLREYLVAGNPQFSKVRFTGTVLSGHTREFTVQNFHTQMLKGFHTQISTHKCSKVSTHRFSVQNFHTQVLKGFHTESVRKKVLKDLHTLNSQMQALSIYLSILMYIYLSIYTCIYIYIYIYSVSYVSYLS